MLKYIGSGSGGRMQPRRAGLVLFFVQVFVRKVRVLGKIVVEQDRQPFLPVENMFPRGLFCVSSCKARTLNSALRFPKLGESSAQWWACLKMIPV